MAFAATLVSALMGLLGPVIIARAIDTYVRHGDFRGVLRSAGVLLIAYLIGFSNRIVVIVRWAWSFLTHGRSSRLITGQPLVPEIEEPEPPA